MRTHYKDIPSYTTKDSSLIRELMHPGQHEVNHQSLAEATIPPGMQTDLHLHQTSEEIYFILEGCGQMTLGKQTFDVTPKDTIVIVPNTPHCIRNTGDDNLIILCMCSPAYSHQDTIIL